MATEVIHRELGVLRWAIGATAGGGTGLLVAGIAAPHPPAIRSPDTPDCSTSG
jgi:hypothetical protein